MYRQARLVLLYRDLLLSQDLEGKTEVVLSFVHPETTFAAGFARYGYFLVFSVATIIYSVTDKLKEPACSDHILSF